MELQLTIKNGRRRGKQFSLPPIEDSMRPTQWLQENEAIEFRLSVPASYSSATLELYEYCIEPTTIQSENGRVIFIWTPPLINGYQYKCLFINYFGLAELNVTLHNENGVEVIAQNFQPIEILASKLNANRVSGMFDYLSTLAPEVLHSVFKATRYSVGFSEGSVAPSFTQERLEHMTDILQAAIPLVIQKPITRLVPEQQLVNPNGFEDIDDSTLGWLLSNTPVLEETDNVEDSHLKYHSKYFKASSLQLPILKANTDLYENQVLHGFVDLLLHEAQMLFSTYDDGSNIQGVSINDAPSNYTSFFDAISKFKKKLLGRKLLRCERTIDRLKSVKILLESHLPTRGGIMSRPSITPKARYNHAYRNIFIEIIRWHEQGKPDWSAYENLFAIKSIHKLFELYCFFRVSGVMKKMLGSGEENENPDNLYELNFIDENGSVVSLRHEPVFWMAGHKQSIGKDFVNSEGWTINNAGVPTRRGKIGPYAQRSPDILIEIKKVDGSATLILMDAKYTYRNKAFSTYLTELTMKYVHGIHQSSSGLATVKSMTILYPDDEPFFQSFHQDQYSIFGAKSVSPSLQSVGLLVGSNAEEDYLEKLLMRIVSIEGVVH